MNSWMAGGIARSIVPSTYQLGMVFHEHDYVQATGELAGACAMREKRA
jgi:hypothetical protein